MSKFTKQIKRTYQFEGDEITVVMGRLKRKDAIKLAPHMVEPDEDGIVRMYFEGSMKFADASCSILRKYITSFTGAHDADGNTLGIEDMFGEDGETYFMNLISEIMGDLMEASFSSNDVEKKLEKRSKDSSGGSPKVELLPSTSEAESSISG